MLTWALTTDGTRCPNGWLFSCGARMEVSKFLCRCPFCLGRRRHHGNTCMELLLRACEDPEPPEWLLWEWANGRASLQHSGFPMASPSPFYYTHHYPHLFSGLCVVLGWPQGLYYSLSQIGSQVPNSSLWLNFPSLDLGFDLFSPSLIYAPHLLFPSASSRFPWSGPPASWGRTQQLRTKDPFIR